MSAASLPGTVPLIELGDGDRAVGRKERRDRVVDRIGHIGTALAQFAGQLPVTRGLRGQVAPTRGPLEIAQQPLRPLKERAHVRHIRFQPDEAPQALQLRQRKIRRPDGVAHTAERGGDLFVHG
jgi:hypothetical protein